MMDDPDPASSWYTCTDRTLVLARRASLLAKQQRDAEDAKRTLKFKMAIARAMFLARRHPELVAQPRPVVEPKPLQLRTGVIDVAAILLAIASMVTVNLS